MTTRFDCNQPIPLLFLGDSPDSPTGLGRIGHDLAWIASSMPEFKVGYLGRQAFGRAALPWIQYTFSAREQWGEEVLERAWNDLAGEQRGIILSVWDASRLLWFAEAGKGTHLEKFLASEKFERWGYFMADASGIHPERLPQEQAHVVSQYKRILMASSWAHELASDLAEDVDWLPHPLNREAFRPADGSIMRSAWGLKDGDILLGCVMANQQRKSWPVVMEAAAILGARLWIHTDVLLGYWNLEALAIEYGVPVLWEGRQLKDKELAARYSACNATVVISGGEGFCYPVAESLSCGVPVVTGTYSAQAELTRWHVEPAAYLIDTSHNVRRAVYQGDDVAMALEKILADRPEPGYCEFLVEHLDMQVLARLWKKWFREGLK